MVAEPTRYFISSFCLKFSHTVCMIPAVRHVREVDVDVGESIWSYCIISANRQPQYNSVNHSIIYLSH